MKNLLKFLIIVGLSILLGWAVFTQTQRGKDYVRHHLSKDADLIKSQILDALNATGVVMTGTDMLSGGEIILSETGAIIVDQAVLDQRLDYYRKAKGKLWNK